MYPYPAAIQNVPSFSRWRSRGLSLIVLFHGVALTACALSSETPPSSISYLVLGVGASCFATLTVYYFSRSPILISLAVFLAVNYTGKLVYAINYPENTFLPILGVEGRELATIVYEKYFLFTIAFVAFSLAAIFASKIATVIIHVRDEYAPAGRISGFIAVAIACYALLALRAVLLLHLKIGAPGVVAAQFSIPYLTGILHFLSSKGTLLFVSGLVAMAICKKTPVAILFSLVTASLYVLIDVMGGWRGPLFRMPFCIVWFFFALGDPQLKKRLKPLVIALVLLPPLLFVPILQYRYMAREGLSPIEAAQASFSLENVTVEDTIADIGKILNRIIGLDMYVIASRGTEDQPLGITRALDPSVGNVFTNQIMGVPKEAITSFACSFWGFWAMLVGSAWIWTGGILLGIAVGVLSPLFLARTQVSFVRAVISCNLTIYFINFMMANGAIVLYAKEALMLFLSCILFNWLCRQKQQAPMPLQQNQWPMQHVGSSY